MNYRTQNYNSNNNFQNAQQMKQQEIINNIASLIQQVGNPDMIIQQLTNQNPQATNLINQMRNSKLNAQEFVVQYAKQNNIDLEPILRGLQQKGIRL